MTAENRLTQFGITDRLSETEVTFRKLAAAVGNLGKVSVFSPTLKFRWELGWEIAAIISKCEVNRQMARDIVQIEGYRIHEIEKKQNAVLRRLSLLLYPEDEQQFDFLSEV